jgi:NAD(P)H-hydrate epimerase
MIPLLSRDSVRGLDRDAEGRLGVPGLVLMENAGRGAFDAIAARFAGALGKAVIVAGPGQNGGDGFVVARHLVQAGHRPSVFLVGEPGALTGDAAHNHRVLGALELPCLVLREGALEPLDAALRDATLIVDALFGTGLTRPVAGVFAHVIERMQGQGAPIVALDLPSGVDADTGAVLGVAPRARLTVTFAAHKRGLHQHPAAELAGEVVCAPIGVPTPRGVIESSAALLEASDVRAWLPPRKPYAHKGSAGHVLVIAGAPGRTGAALLSGLGALRAGAGLVTIATQGAARAALDQKVVELMTEALPSDLDDALSRVHELAKGKQAAVVGPGFGTDPDAVAFLRALAIELELPCVLDADALSALATNHAFLQRAQAPRVLTPHPGEAARMLGCAASEVQADRFAAAQRLAAQTAAVVVLKGARTIIASPHAPPRVCPTGTPAMAVAGTGDVLAGTLGALLGQVLNPLDAACAATYLHGLAGQLAAGETGSDRGLLASELAGHLPMALAACHAGSSF